MGSPISASLADYVMEYIEEEILKTLDSDLPFYFRFVDDIITAIHIDKTDELLSKFNNFNKNIQFTIETEKENKLAFLNVEITRQPNGDLKTNIYHKIMWSGRYLNYNSHLPSIYKRNTIHILTQRILKLSHPDYREDNFTHLEHILKSNNYPPNVIQPEIRRAKNKENTNIGIRENNIQKYVAIPYVKGLFENIKNLLKKYNIIAVGNSLSPLSKSIFSKRKTTHLKNYKVI